ncbi:unnamed protein product [Symbiodinium microadriaticum]|nr:unnamed protein product [Symbiodinium sp. KB8]CAE7267375.1 unnamed protein product [Symbiodinium microadriaticum]
MADGRGVPHYGCILPLEQGQITVLDPHRRHAVLPWKGLRIVLVAYTPGMIRKLPGSDREVLSRLGFPIPPEAEEVFPEVALRALSVGARVHDRFEKEVEEEPWFEQEIGDSGGGSGPSSSDEEKINGDFAMLAEEEEVEHWDMFLPLEQGDPNLVPKAKIASSSGAINMCKMEVTYTHNIESARDPQVADDILSGSLDWFRRKARIVACGNMMASSGEDNYAAAAPAEVVRSSLAISSRRGAVVNESFGYGFGWGYKVEAGPRVRSEPDILFDNKSSEKSVVYYQEQVPALFLKHLPRGPESKDYLQPDPNLLCDKFGDLALDIMHCDGRKSSKFLESSAMEAWPNLLSASEAQCFGQRLFSLLEHLHLKKKQSSDGPKLHPSARQVVTALKERMPGRVHSFGSLSSSSPAPAHRPPAHRSLGKLPAAMQTQLPLIVPSKDDIKNAYKQQLEVEDDSMEVSVSQGDEIEDVQSSHSVVAVSSGEDAVSVQDEANQGVKDPEYYQYYSSGDLSEVRLYADGSYELAQMSHGPDGFCFAKLKDGSQHLTEMPNALLKTSKKSQSKSTNKKRPAAAPSSKPTAKHAKAAPVAQHAAPSSATDSSNLDVQPAPIDQQAAEEERPRGFTVGAYNINYYKPPRHKYGIKTQGREILCLPVREKPWKAVATKIREVVLAELSQGKDPAEVKAAALAGLQNLCDAQGRLFDREDFVKVMKTRAQIWSEVAVVLDGDARARWQGHLVVEVVYFPR